MEELLKKYWNCETTLEEEKQLREFFGANHIPDQLKDTAALFRYFEEAKKKSLNDVAFEGQVLRKVNPSRGKVAKLIYNTMRIAAGLAVVIAATWFIRNEIRDTTPQAVVDTYNDPKLAFEETKKALLMISKSFGTAEEQARKINMFNEAQEEIQGKN
ncbi:hypothetical protein [Chryseolinea sp. H1M3-3]|uniref:hypothetical protein n=1 Tax=Chryseolinea sp. H1M3-3 TaxID=3034144 RepID=UPI0023EAE412|nr:hypothetical protein [Chryseolinea sp. H1M3-3]